jgi:hypothetical protein
VMSWRTRFRKPYSSHLCYWRSYAASDNCGLHGTAASQLCGGQHPTVPRAYGSCYARGLEGQHTHMTCYVAHDMLCTYHPSWFTCFWNAV